MTLLRPDAFATPYRDPVFDGPTDPVVVEDTVSGGWLLFYTQRRASLPLEGVAWVHGTQIGQARSIDRGLTWTYEGTVLGLDEQGRTRPHLTFWAPDVVRVGHRWLMFLTVVHGIHTDWQGRATIEQFESTDLKRWSWTGRVPIDSERVIDAAVAQTDDGLYRLWYKDETRGSTTFCAVTCRPEDPASWREKGEVISGRAHEGPKVFRLGGWWWMIVDEWRGLAVHRSTTGIGNWQRQHVANGLILQDAGGCPGQCSPGHHADVVALEPDPRGEDRALIVYFTHVDGRASTVRAAVLRVTDDNLFVEAAPPSEETTRG